MSTNRFRIFAILDRPLLPWQQNSPTYFSNKRANITWETLWKQNAKKSHRTNNFQQANRIC